MGLFGKVKGKASRGAKKAGRSIFKRALKPTGKGIWRGMREYDERVLDPLGAAAIQAGSELNKQTFVLDFSRLARGEQPFVHGRRTFFGEEITPRTIDYGKIAFGSGEERRREQEKAHATFEEAGFAGEMLAKSAVDPLNLFVLKSGTVEPTVKSLKLGYRALRGLTPGQRAARQAARELAAVDEALSKPSLLSEEERRFLVEERSKLVEKGFKFTEKALPGPEEPGGVASAVEAVDKAIRTAPAKPVAETPNVVGASLNESIPDLSTIAADIMSEQARSSMILSSRLARPFRFITNRFVGSANTVKAEALDARIALEADKFEKFNEGANLAAILVDDQMAKLGFVKQFDQDVVTLKSGLTPTMRDLMERPHAFKLAPEEAAAVEAAQSTRKSVYEWGVNALENHFIDEGMTSAEATAKTLEIIKVAELEEGQAFWPRIPVVIGETEQAMRDPSFFRVGSVAPNLQLPRTAELPGGVVRHSGDPGAVLANYAKQIFYKVQTETVIRPLLKRLAIDPKTITPTAFRATVDSLTVRREWLKDVETLLGKAPGLSGKQLAARLSRFRSSDIPEEWGLMLDRLQIDEILEAPTTRDLAKRTEVATGEAARAAEPEQAVVKLGKAAEARISAGKAKAGVKALKQRIALIRKEMKVLRQENDIALKYAKKQLRTAERLARGEYRRLPLSEFPGITDVFDTSMVRQIEQAFNRLDPNQVPGFAAAVNNWVGIGVNIQAGSFDVGFIALQMLPGFATNPLAFPAVLMRMTSNKAYLGAIKNLQAQKFRDGRSMLEVMSGSGLRFVNEPLMPDVMMIKPGTVAGKVGRVTQSWPLNRVFTRGINLSRMSVAKTGVRLWENIFRRPLTPNEYRSIMRVANMITGDFNWTRAGVGQTQRVLERVGLRYAPTWLRANLQWIATAAHPSISVETMSARMALAATVGTVVGLYSLAALAVGQTPKLDPRKTGEFMTIRMGGMRVGPGGVMVQVARTVGKASLLADKAINGETKEEREEALKDLVDIREGRNPLRQFWRAGAPVIGGLIYDMTANEGVQSYTQKKLDLSPAGLQAIGESLVLPFAPQSAIAHGEEGPAGMVSREGIADFFGTFLGGRAFPVSPPGLFIEAADKAAQQEGFPSWEKTPKATRADILRKSPELQAAEQARKDYYARFPGKQKREEFVFGEVDKSRQATETALLAMWGAVQDGTRDISEFRQAFTDLMGKHGYLSSQLMDGLDPNLKRRSDETLGDYYARMFYTIQPEAFDGKAIAGDFPDGVISPQEWEMWREEREKFWRTYPEARVHRSYIESDYPTRNWDTQEMADLHRRKIAMNTAYQEFLDIPKYQGLSAEAGNFIDTMIGLADRKAREIRFELARRGVDVKRIRVPKKVAWRLVVADLEKAGLSAQQWDWMGYAVLFSLKSKARRAALSSARAQYLMDNDEIAEWYPSAYGDAGLGDREIAMLGLTGAPLGQSVQQRVAAAV